MKQIYVLTLSLIYAHGFLSASCPADVKPRPIYPGKLRFHIAHDTPHHLLRFLNQNADNVNAVSPNGESMLQYALAVSADKVTEMLIMRGADVTQDSFQLLRTVLESTQRRKWTKKDYLKLLIDNGANVNARSEIGVTPFILAVELGNVEAAEYLIERDADITAQTRQGFTASTFATHNQEMKKLLEEAAKKTKKD